MDDKQIELNWEFYEFLLPALRDNSHYVCIPASRRSGKTYNTKMWLLREGIIYPNLPMLWVDTRQVNIEKYVFRYNKAILGEKLFNRCDWSAKKFTFTLPNGSYIDYGSAQFPERLEGFGYKRGVVNEAGIVFRNANLWDKTIRPMVKDQDCQVKLIGTPKGKNTFHKLCTRGFDRLNSSEWATYRYTCYDSPNFTPKEIEELKTTTDSISFSQEYMAEFIDDAGAVFRGLSRCIKKGMPDSPIKGREYILGIDLAKHVDFTVISVIDRKTKEVVEIDRFNQLDWVFQKKRIFEKTKKWNDAEIFLDSTGNGDSIFDDLVHAGLKVTPFKFTNPSKAELVQNLSVAIENGEISLPDMQEMKDELELFEFNMTRAGNITYSAPEGFHDDIVMSLGLAWHGIKNSNPFAFAFS